MGEGQGSRLAKAKESLGICTEGQLNLINKINLLNKFWQLTTELYKKDCPLKKNLH